MYKEVDYQFYQLCNKIDRLYEEIERLKEEVDYWKNEYNDLSKTYSDSVNESLRQTLSLVFSIKKNTNSEVVIDKQAFKELV